MDVYKGTGAFSGIAIGKILYYHKSEYQMRQYEITDVKTELNIFRQARTRVMEQLEDLYEKNCIIQGTQAEIFLRQKNLLEGKSLWGGSLGYAYNSIAGPLSATFGMSNRNSHLQFYMNLGFMF